MKLTVSWWDKKEGIGVAISDSGVECLLHRSNLSSTQVKTLQARMIISGEVEKISSDIFIVTKVRTSKNFESASNFQKRLTQLELL